MEIADVTKAVEKSEFRMFSEMIQEGGAVKCLVAPLCSLFTKRH